MSLNGEQNCVEFYIGTNTRYRYPKWANFSEFAKIYFNACFANANLQYNHRKLGRDYLLPRQCLHFDVFIRHRTEPYSVAVGTAKSGLFFQGIM